MTIETAAEPIPASFREAEERIADVLPDYEPRPAQQALAKFIEDVLAGNEQGMAQAGTGVGKSFGALVPAILAAKNSGKRVIIATTTKALQNQYIASDVPFLHENLGFEFKTANLKGRSNYACLAKLNDADPLDNPWVVGVGKELEENSELVGDIESFQTPVTPWEFSRITTGPDECPGKARCTFGDVCKSELAKKKADEADVVIVNTALLITDLKFRRAKENGTDTGMLGDFDAVIIDEAHELEDTTTNMLSDEESEEKIIRLVDDVATFASDQNASIGGSGLAVKDSASKVFWMFGQAKNEKPKERVVGLNYAYMVDNSEPIMELITDLRSLGDALRNIRCGGDERATNKKRRISSRLQNTAKFLEEVMLADDASLARWVEEEERGKGRFHRKILFLRTAPVRVSGFLTEKLWNRIVDEDGTPQASVLISATMTTGKNDFSHLQDRLGLKGSKTLDVGTPFEYRDQSRLFLPPPSAPSPKPAERSAWLTYSAETTLELIDAAGGGALLLFTSRTGLESSHKHLADRIRARGYNVYKQGGDQTNAEIARLFKQDTHSVLFGLASFMTGFDAAGDTCRLVVIDKLPFAVPTDPIVKARSDEVERRGGSSFFDLSIPEMTLTLTQAFGRLIRRTTDFGVVAILDSRLTSSAWGKKIVKGLPSSPQTSSLADVRAFYEANRSA